VTGTGQHTAHRRSPRTGRGPALALGFLAVTATACEEVRQSTSAARTFLTPYVEQLRELASAVEGLRGSSAAERAILVRQVERLRELVAASENGPLFDPDQLLVLVDQKLVQAMLSSTMPWEEVVGGHFRVRATSVEVRFEDNVGLLRVDGSISSSLAQENEDIAELTLYADIDVVELDPTSGILSGQVSLLAYELRPAGLLTKGAVAPFAPRLMDELGRLGLNAFVALVRPFEIPVLLERDIEIAGLGPEGPVTLAPGRVALSIGVSSVRAFDGRLWVSLDANPHGWDSGATRNQDSPRGAE